MNESIKNIIKSRNANNHKILEAIQEYIDKYPEIRFGQALVNLGIIKYDSGNVIRDPFYEEPCETLCHMKFD